MVSTLKNPDLKVISIIFSKKHLKFLDEKIIQLKSELGHYTVNRSVVVRSILDDYIKNDQK